MEENREDEILEEKLEEEEEGTFFQTVPMRNERESPDEILKRIEETLDIFSEKVAAAEDTHGMYESIVDLYNSFNSTARHLTEKLSKEVEYTRYLESEIDKKKYHLEYLSLKMFLLFDFFAYIPMTVLAGIIFSLLIGKIV